MTTSTQLRPPLATPGPDETVVRVQAARVEHRCDATGCPWCPGVIRSGETYDLWTAFPTHTDLGQRGGYGSKPWSARVCSTCGDFFVGNDLAEILDPAVTL